MGFFDRFQAPMADVPDDPNASRSTMPMPVANDYRFGGMLAAPIAKATTVNNPGLQDWLAQRQGQTAQMMLNIGSGPRPNAGMGRLLYDAAASRQPQLQQQAQQAGPLRSLMPQSSGLSGMVRMIGPDGTEDHVHPSQVQNAMRIGARRIG